jgi:hypothetical protein
MASDSPAELRCRRSHRRYAARSHGRPDGGNRLDKAHANERIIGVRIFAVKYLIRLEAKDFAIEMIFVVINLLRETMLVELQAHTTGIERIDGARLVSIVLHAVEQGEERVVGIYLLLVVAVQLVKPKFSIGYFTGNGINGRIDPADETCHCFGSINGLCAGWLVNPERIATECL